MNIKIDIESLIESISSIEKRHLLEILGVIDGTKNVMRIHINLYKEYEILLIFAKKHNLFVIEDNAQGIGCDYTFSDGTVKKTGTIGHIGCTSFFPTKNLGCYGDGGAVFSNNRKLANQIKIIAGLFIINHFE